jgi:ribose transport system permease protein
LAELETAVAPPGAAAVGAPRQGPSRAARLLQQYGIVLVFVVLVAVVGSIDPRFLESTNLLNMAQQWAPVGLMAMAGTYVIIGGGFDLSVGGIFALAGVLAAGLSQDVGLGVAYFAVVGVGIVFGVANGLLVTKVNVNPFIATIASGQVARGLALIYTAGSPILVTAGGFGFLGSERIGDVAVSAIILLVAFVVGGIVLARTVYGRWVYAVGGNTEASRLTGLPVDRVLVVTYVISGVAAALAGFVFASRLGIGQPDAGVGIEFDVIIAIVLGGTAIGGGIGAMWRTLVGVALLAVMQNGFDTLGVESFYQVLIKGMILIVAVAWDEWVRRSKAHV